MSKDSNLKYRRIAFDFIFIPSSVSTHFLSEAVTTAVGDVAEAGEDGFDLGPNRIVLVRNQIFGGKLSFCFENLVCPVSQP